MINSENKLLFNLNEYKEKMTDMARIHASKKIYIDPIVNHIKANLSNRVTKLTVFGESVDENVDDPFSLDIAVGLLNEDEYRDYKLLGEIMDCVSGIVTKGDFDVVLVNESKINKLALNEIKKGIIIWENNNIATLC